MILNIGTNCGEIKRRNLNRFISWIQFVRCLSNSLTVLNCQECFNTSLISTAWQVSKYRKIRSIKNSVSRNFSRSNCLLKWQISICFYISFNGLVTAFGNGFIEQKEVTNINPCFGTTILLLRIHWRLSMILKISSKTVMFFLYLIIHIF